MSQTKNAVTQGAAEITLKEERKSVTIARTKSGKAKTGKQLARTLAAEKRKATNDAGKLLVSAMREQLHSLPIIRQIFEGAPESVTFCQALSIETGKAIDVRAVLSIPMRQYLDYITDIEATRQHVRGITIAEFRNVIVRYYRDERKSVVKLDSAAIEILRQYVRYTDI
jgi:hypothetical protein